MTSSVVKSDPQATTASEPVQDIKGNGDSGAKKEKAAKRRKWGSKTSKAAKVVRKPSTMEISSDSLKGLIGEVKMTETVFDLETEAVNTLDYDEQEEDLRDIKVKRTFVQASPKPAEPMEQDDEPVVIEEDARRVENTRQDDGADANDNDPIEGDDRHVEPTDENAGDPVAVSPSPEPEKKIIKVVPKEGGKKKGKDKEGKKLKKKKEGAIAAAGKESKTDKSEKAEAKKEKVIATHRPSKPLVPQADEPEQVSSSKAPARFPVSRVLKINGLVRPFTLGQLKELLKRTGDLDDSLFWINSIKSECLAAYANEDDAVKTRGALHGTRWPLSNPKILDVDFASEEEVKHRQGGGVGPLPTKKLPSREEPEKAAAKPRDTRDEDQERRKARELREKEREEREKEREKREKEREKRRDAERKNPVREWDRDKVQQTSRSRSRSKGREDDRSRRSRESGRDKEDRKRRERSRDDEKKKEKKQKAEEEPPAKLLDDLFRKTKATPCIYWLPLTEDQAQLRESQREEKEKERQKRLAAIEERHKEEEKKREAARQERMREREKERNREREKEKERNRERERDRERNKEKERERDRDRSRRRDRSSKSRSSSRSRSRRRR